MLEICYEHRHNILFKLSLGLFLIIPTIIAYYAHPELSGLHLEHLFMLLGLGLLALIARAALSSTNEIYGRICRLSVHVQSSLMYKKADDKVIDHGSYE